MNLNFKPTLWLSVFTCIFICILLSLGTWQMHRLAWKNNIIDQIDKNISGDSIFIEDMFDARKYDSERIDKSLDIYNFRPVHVNEPVA